MVVHLDREIEAKYEILETMGEGGMGSIYKARHRHLDVLRVIKITRFQNDEILRRRFISEAQRGSQLNHPNIARILDFAITESGTAYIVMEYIDGVTTLDLLARNPPALSPILVTDIALQTLAGLEYLHEHRVVHRDIAPDNIMVTAADEQGHRLVKLIDLGISKSMNEPTSLTETGRFIGKVRYASPEQFIGDVDRRSDLYSLGLVLHELLTGKVPFKETDFREVMVAHIAGKLLPFEESDARGRVPANLRAVIVRSLQTDPEARFQSAAEFAAALREAEKQANAQTVLADLGSFQLPPSPAAASKPVGTKQLGRYTILEEIASGRSGRLYKAFDPVRGRLVGLKVVDSGHGVDRERMLRAARVWVDIVHENIVRIFDVDPGGADHGPLIVTELVSGMRLDQFVIETPLNLEQRILIVAQICRALHHVHAQGVIHREVTPENILIVRDGMKAMLLDSGIARPVTPEGVMLTHAGSVVGDLAYMAPEQVNGRPEQRSDLFSLGAVLYLLLTGNPPSVLDLTRFREEIGALADVPVRVREVLLKALEPLPPKRYESAEAFESALKDLLPLEVTRVPRSRMVVTLHGIRTHAKWQRAFSEVAAEANLRCLLDRWNFGYFSVFRFIFPWSRATRISWFRKTYQDEFPELMRTTADTELPSIVAHSFGTYILGHALLRYPYLRFDRVILCGSILPPDFPWLSIIGRGQVQAVRNEYGAQDFWTHYVNRFVPRTGPSGIFGFRETGQRVEQEKFDFSHSEYFERSHMQSRWLPFLLRRMEPVVALEQNVPALTSGHPWALYTVYVALLTVFAIIGWVALK